MALQLHIPAGPVPALLHGTIDGIVPVRYRDLGDRWELSIGADWRHEARHDVPPAERTAGAIRPAIYGAVATYRNAQRSRELRLAA
ncbi:hypothetical protein LAZ40_11135 [Cereibacter sphaeroides]|uniref:hypothetical protein n=1 Tax=Cereibacter sphaeroides TaxID=1063 RepID=UPI001F33577F|nr:hypothetical protein [Cereibacter sphaeroides]MCE6959609.1 hypothetical protein [Cereibacter sphaeroides]MCE6974531.1 hypothetical protein [Cereibacter sphaeroides]